MVYMDSAHSIPLEKRMTKLTLEPTLWYLINGTSLISYDNDNGYVVDKDNNINDNKTDKDNNNNDDNNNIIRN